MSAVPKPETRSKFVSFRWTESEHKQISRLAKESGMTLTDYVVQSALGKLAASDETQRRLGELEGRVARLEEYGLG